MSDAEKIAVLRGAVIGLLGMAAEEFDDIGPCDHRAGICRCRLGERMAEAQAALKETAGATRHADTLKG